MPRAEPSCLEDLAPDFTSRTVSLLERRSAIQIRSHRDSTFPPTDVRANGAGRARLWTLPNPFVYDCVRVEPVVVQSLPDVSDGPRIPFSHFGVALPDLVYLQIFGVNVRATCLLAAL